MNRRQSILITGGTGRIGRVLVRHFVQAGWQVVVPSRSRTRIGELLDSCTAATAGQLVGIELDLVADGAVPRLLEELQAREVRPVALVNGARDLSRVAFDEQGLPLEETWLHEYRINVVVPFMLGNALAHQPDSRLRSIVNLTSMYGNVAINPWLQGETGRWPAHYGCAKAAMIQLTREMAVRLAPRGVRVNAVSFGGVEGRVDEEFRERYRKLCPQGRMLEDADLPGVVGFLVSDAASGMTGANLALDGGWTAW